MKKLFIILVASILSSCYSQVFNGNFEYFEPNVLSGLNTPTGWVCKNYVTVTNEFVCDPNPACGHSFNWKVYKITPFKNDNFILLKPGDFKDGEGAETWYSKAQQRFSINSSCIISGVYFFGSYDYLPYDDYFYIKLIPPPQENRNEIILAQGCLSQLKQNYCSMYGWKRFEHTFVQEEYGLYDLVLYINNYADCILDSFLMVDSISICENNLGNSDLNCDCKVNFEDFNILASQWMNDCNDTNCNLGNDINADGIIDYNDLLIMAENWNISGKKIFNFIDYTNIINNSPNPMKLLYIISREWLK
jgi:hypothetical protein